MTTLLDLPEEKERSRKPKVSPEKISNAPVQKKEDEDRGIVLFLLLFLAPLAFFLFTPWMAAQIQTDIADDLVYGLSGGEWAHYYLSLSTSVGILVTGLLALGALTKKKRTAVSALLLLLFFGIGSFAFLYAAPHTKVMRVLPQPKEEPAAAPVKAEEPKTEPAPIVAIEPAPAPAPVVKKKWYYLNLFPVFIKNETALGILFPLYCHWQREGVEAKSYISLLWYKIVDKNEISTGIFPFYEKETKMENGKVTGHGNRVFMIGLDNNV